MPKNNFIFIAPCPNCGSSGFWITEEEYTLAEDCIECEVCGTLLYKELEEI